MRRFFFTAKNASSLNEIGIKTCSKNALFCHSWDGRSRSRQGGELCQQCGDIAARATFYDHRQTLRKTAYRDAKTAYRADAESSDVHFVHNKYGRAEEDFSRKRNPLTLRNYNSRSAALNGNRISSPGVGGTPYGFSGLGGSRYGSIFVIYRLFTFQTAFHINIIVFKIYI